MSKTWLLIATLLTLCIAPFANGKTISIQFQEALFIEETEGDIDAAISQYQEILKNIDPNLELTEEDEQTISKVNYQLGLCYLKQGNKEKAKEQLMKLLSDYNCHNTVVNQARNLLQEINPEFASQNREVNLLPEPWGKYEHMRHKLYAQNGGEIGLLIYEIKKKIEKGLSVSKITTSEILPYDYFPKETGVTVLNNNFKPLNSFTQYGPNNRSSAIYNGNKITYTSVKNGKESRNETKVELPVFDNEQTLYLIRRLPLKVGYRDSAMVFSNSNGMSVKGELHVDAIEDVNTEFGTLNCYRAKVNSSMQGTQNFEQTVWISTDSRRLIAKVITGKTTFKLVSVNNSSSSSETINDEDMDIILPLDKGYHIYDSPSTGPFDAAYQIYSPETMVYSRIWSLEPKNRKSDSEFVDNQIRLLGKHWKKFKVQRGTRINTTINGINAIQFVADVQYHEKSPNNMIEYCTYFLTDKRVHCLIMRTDKNHLPQVKAKFDEVIEKVQLK